jgi:hypothetical protein
VEQDTAWRAALLPGGSIAPQNAGEFFKQVESQVRCGCVAVVWPSGGLGVVLVVALVWPSRWCIGCQHHCFEHLKLENCVAQQHVKKGGSGHC